MFCDHLLFGDHCAADATPLAIEILSRRMDNNISAKFDRALQCRGTKTIIYC